MSVSIRGLMTFYLLYSPGSFRFLQHHLAHPPSSGKVVQRTHHRKILAGHRSGIACAPPRCRLAVPGGQVVALPDALVNCLPSLLWACMLLECGVQFQHHSSAALQLLQQPCMCVGV